MSKEKSMDIKLRTGNTVTVSVDDTLALYNVNLHGRRQSSRDLLKVTVTKIGRKWITFRNGFDVYQFNSNGEENSDYSHNSLYLSQDSYEESVKAEALFRKFEEKLKRTSRRDFGCEQIQRAAKALGLELDLEE